MKDDAEFLHRLLFKASRALTSSTHARINKAVQKVKLQILLHIKIISFVEIWPPLKDKSNFTTN